MRESEARLRQYLRLRDAQLCERLDESGNPREAARWNDIRQELAAVQAVLDGVHDKRRAEHDA
jgi:hypothetical protein